MMTHNTYSLITGTIVALTVGFTVYMIAEGTKENNKSYYETVNKCIEHNGTWITQTQQCIRNK